MNRSKSDIHISLVKGLVSVKVSIAVILFCALSLFGQNIKFAPLPKEKIETLEKEYRPFLEWLSKNTGDNYEFVMAADYRDLINKIKSGEVDIAYLGPLPYAIIRQQTDIVKPIVKFLDKSGNSAYTCSIITRKNSAIHSVKELKGKKISLTQKYSTCGYYTAKLAFDSEKIPLENYSFDGNHANVALNVLLGESDAGSLQTNYFKKYEYLGLKKIYESKELPGFMLAANIQKLSNTKIQKIKTAIAKLSPVTNEKDAELTKKWSENIKYGAVEASEADYMEIVNKAKEMAALR